MRHFYWTASAATLIRLDPIAPEKLAELGGRFGRNGRTSVQMGYYRLERLIICQFSRCHWLLKFDCGALQKAHLVGVVIYGIAAGR